MTGRKRVPFSYRTFVPGLLHMTSEIYIDFDEAAELYLVDDEMDLLN
jgi:hypothetical protein